MSLSSVSEQSLYDNGIARQTTANKHPSFTIGMAYILQYVTLNCFEADVSSKFRGFVN